VPSEALRSLVKPTNLEVKPRNFEVKPTNFQVKPRNMKKDGLARVKPSFF